MIDWLMTTYWGKMLVTAAISMLPVLELRGSIPIGVAMGLDVSDALCASLIGNMLPVPFIILFLRKIFALLRKNERFAAFVTKLESTAEKKGKVVEKYKAIGLCILVAIPLPGTGAWTGALVAACMKMRLITALPSIGIGVVIAGIIVTTITYGANALLW